MQLHLIGVSFLRCKYKVLQIYFFLNHLLVEKKLSCIDIASLVFFFFDISLRGILCGGGQGKREAGRKGGGRYGRREKKGREAAFPRWR